MEVSFSFSACGDMRRIFSNCVEGIKEHVQQLDNGQDDTNSYLHHICEQNETVIALLTAIKDGLHKNKQ